jgi:hypothetical protein
MKKEISRKHSGFAHIGLLLVVLVLPLLFAANYLYQNGLGNLTIPQAQLQVPGRGGTGDILVETWENTQLYDNDAPKPGAGIKTWVRSMTIHGCSTESILTGPCQGQTSTMGPLRNNPGVGIDIIPVDGRKVARFWLQQNTGSSHGARLIIANNISDNAFLRPWGNRRIYARYYMKFPQQLPVAASGGSWMSIGVEMKDQKLDQRATIQQNYDREHKFWQAFAQNNINQSFTNTDHVFQGNRWYQVDVIWDMFYDNRGRWQTYIDGVKLADSVGKMAHNPDGYGFWIFNLYGDILQNQKRGEMYIGDVILSTQPIGNSVPTTTVAPTVNPTPRPTVTPPPVATLRPTTAATPRPSASPVMDISVPKNAFKGTYYNNKDFTDQKFVRTDSSVNFNWGYGSPDPSISSDTFSVKWEGDWNFSTAGLYEFNVTTDDGMRIYVDNNLVLDQWRDQYGSHKFNVNVTQGTHRIKIDYYDNTVYSTAIANWKLIAAATPVPTPVRTLTPTFAPVVTAAPTTNTISAVPVNAFRGIYYNNSNYTDQKFVRTDPSINFNWAWGSPSFSLIHPDTFTVRWDGNWDFATSDNYLFNVTTDDGMTIEIDGQLVLNKWFDQHGTHSFTKYLTAGRHYIKVGYYENGGYSTAVVKWNKI